MHDNRVQINLDINVNNSKRLVININAVDNNVLKRDRMKLPVKCLAAAGEEIKSCFDLRKQRSARCFHV